MNFARGNRPSRSISLQSLQSLQHLQSLKIALSCELTATAAVFYLVSCILVLLAAIFEVLKKMHTFMVNSALTSM
jgi:hypothetical protein